jgi:plasmid stabilization system protein ParE
MVKRKIEWLAEAKLDLKDILDFYIERNGSAVYSKKLNLRFSNSIQLLEKNPFIGIKTDYNNVRSLIKDDYQIIYEIFDSSILILIIWDCRRDPDDIRIGQRIK